MTRALIIDDERIARAELRRLLQAYRHIEIVGEASDVDDALRQIEAVRPEVVFLDMEMPGGSGLELARKLVRDVRIVFCTAHSAFAADAFAVNALDFLLKPVSVECLARAVARLSAPNRLGPDYLAYDFGIMLKFGDSARMVRLREIDRFESVGNYVAVQCRHGTALMLGTVSRVEERLDPQYFLRANRAEIVRIDAIRCLDTEVGGGLVATLENGARVEISRRQAQALRSRMEVF